MTRRRFPAKALAARLSEFGGCCADCAWPVGGAAGLEWDHITPLKMGGEDALENLQPLCRPCHRAKTRLDAGHIAKAKRMRQRMAGIGKTVRRPVPGSRLSGWKKPIYGPAIRRE